MDISSQELIEHSLFYSRREQELQEKLQKLLESLEDDEELELEVINLLDSEEEV